mmetsp:Transcript_21142/g.56345  ORF Transcript_21142/g.56345 Transcript_21142/m.56345 type:complete len:420 (-) Transcript_21142:806-2065(-)
MGAERMRGLSNTTTLLMLSLCGGNHIAIGIWDRRCILLQGFQDLHRSSGVQRKQGWGNLIVPQLGQQDLILVEPTHSLPNLLVWSRVGPHRQLSHEVWNTGVEDSSRCSPRGARGGSPKGHPRYVAHSSWSHTTSTSKMPLCNGLDEGIRILNGGSILLKLLQDFHGFVWKEAQEGLFDAIVHELLNQTSVRVQPSNSLSQLLIGLRIWSSKASRWHSDSGLGLVSRIGVPPRRHDDPGVGIAHCAGTLLELLEDQHCLRRRNAEQVRCDLVVDERRSERHVVDQPVDALLQLSVGTHLRSYLSERLHLQRHGRTHLAHHWHHGELTLDADVRRRNQSSSAEMPTRGLDDPAIGISHSRSALLQLFQDNHRFCDAHLGQLWRDFIVVQRSRKRDVGSQPRHPLSQLVIAHVGWRPRYGV